MRNPLLSDGITVKPLSDWRKQFRGYAIEKDDNKYIIQNYNLQVVASLVNIAQVPRAQYMRKYRVQKNKIFYDGMKINDLAKIKFTTRMTIYNNLHKLDLIPNSRPLQIKCNNKIWNI